VADGRDRQQAARSLVAAQRLASTAPAWPFLVMLVDKPTSGAIPLFVTFSVRSSYGSFWSLSKGSTHRQERERNTCVLMSTAEPRTSSDADVSGNRRRTEARDFSGSSTPCYSSAEGNRLKKSNWLGIFDMYPRVIFAADPLC